jgi:mono/diheme cytochrome c family protein
MTHTLKALVGRSCGLALALLGTALGCGAEGNHAGEPIAHRRLRVDTASPPAALTISMLHLGDSVFHGRVDGAGCSGCHLPQAPEAPDGSSGPDLGGSEWLRTASYGMVVHFLAHGERKARREGTGGPHSGAASLSAAELRAVALYVGDLNRRDGEPSRYGD